MQFARVAQATDFIYCYTILESNKRLEHTGASASTSTNSQPGPGSNYSTPSSTITASNRPDSVSATAELNTFFPFDPYRLPKSAVFIKDIYRDWSSVAIDDESDDEGSEDNEEIEAETEYTYKALRSSSEERHLAIPRRNRPGLNAEVEDETTESLGVSVEQMSLSPRLGGAFTSSSVMSITVDRIK
jgi:RNA polymerase I-specific transcription initiation factor RRN3